MFSLASCARSCATPTRSRTPKRLLIFVATLATTIVAMSALASGSARAAVIVDTTITSGPASITNSTSATFSFKSNRSTAKFQCSLDGSAFSTCKSPKSYSSLSSGSHTFRVRATYLIWTDPTPATATWSIDITPPETSITSGPPKLGNSTAVQFTIATNDSSASIRCKIDDAAYAPCVSPFSTSVTDGTHTLFAVSVDPAGNIDPSPATRAFTVYRTPPDTEFVATPPAHGTSPNVSFEFRAVTASLPYPPDCDPRYMICLAVIYEIGASTECSLDNASFTACNSPYSATSLSVGGHTFAVRAVDEAGNVDPTPPTFAFTIDPPAPVDTIPPDTYLTGPQGVGGGPTDNEPRPTFSFISTERPADFECKLETGTVAGSAPFGDCTSIDHFTPATPLADGAYVFSVRAIDAAGNVDQSPAIYKYVLETTSPDTTIASGPSGTTTEARPTFTFSGSESPTYFECKLESGTTPGNARFRGCSSSYQPSTALRDGTYTLSVRGYDGANNFDQTPATSTFTVATGTPPSTDTTPPETTIVSDPGAVTSNAAPSFQFTSSETGSTFECKLEMGDAPGTVDFGSCSNGPGGIDATRADRPGLVHFSVRAIDSAGNVDPTPDTRTVRITPNTWVNFGPYGTVDYNLVHFFMVATEPSTTSRGPLPVASFECKLENGAAAGSAPFGPCSGPGRYHVIADALADGTYTFTARAIGADGVPDPTPYSRTFTINTASPNTTITSGPASPTADNTPTFTFTSSDPAAAFECAIDRQTSYFSCGSGYTLPFLPEGQHTFYVRARNSVGADLTPASQTFTVDTSPPLVSPPVTGCAAAYGVAFCTSTANPYFDMVVGCSIDGATLVGCNRSFAVRLPVGTHTIDVTIEDDIQQIRHEVFTVTVL